MLAHEPAVAAARTTAGGHDFRPLLGLIAPQLRRADLAVCHLETPLSALLRTGHLPNAAAAALVASWQRTLDRVTLLGAAAAVAALTVSVRRPGRLHWAGRTSIPRMSPTEPDPVRILLVGLMAVGKTTVGVPLAAELGCRYLDNDELVRQATGTALEDLKERVGGEGLHEAESAALDVALRTRPPVIASVAAWVVTPADNRRKIRDSGAFTVWLRARPETLAARVGDGGDRPWLRPDPLTAFRAMAAERSGWYAEVSNLTVDVDDDDAGHAVEQILEGLRGWSGRHRT